MKFTTKSRYGTRMILDIALHGENGPVRISDISKRESISPKYLEKLVRDLKRAGYIKSKRGPKGGHVLATPMEDITVGDIVRALEGDHRLCEFENRSKGCNRSAGCRTRPVWTEIEKIVTDKLNSITIADLASDEAVLCLDD